MAALSVDGDFLVIRYPIEYIQVSDKTAGGYPATAIIKAGNGHYTLEGDEAEALRDHHLARKSSTPGP